MNNFLSNYGVWYLAYIILGAWLPESRHMKLAKRIRNRLGRKVMSNCSGTANIDRKAVFSKKCSIGERSGIGINCQIYGSVEIGNNVMMGPECCIYTTGHEHSRTDIPMIEQGSTPEKKVIIEDDVWIGRRVIIMPGVTIAKGCIIGAGAVVTKDTLPYGVYGGDQQRGQKIDEYKNMLYC